MARKSLYAVNPDDDPYLRRKREQEERARDVPRPVPVKPSHPDSEPRPKSTPPVQNVPRPKTAPRPDAEPRRGYLQLTNHFIYDLLPTLKPTDSVVLLYLLARTHGWQKTRVEVALTTIGTAVHISRSQARVSLAALEARKHIKIVTKAGERGYVIDVLVPRSESAPPSESAPRSKYVPIKDRDYKRTGSKEVAPPSEEDRAEYERIRAELSGSGKS